MDLRYAIAFSMLPGIGCATQRMLLDYVGTPEQLFQLRHNDVVRIFGTHRDAVIHSVEHPDAVLRRADEELEFCQRHDIQILFSQDADYPQRLNREECSDCPMVLYYKGSARLNAPRTVGIVGSRRATDYGRGNVERLVRDLKEEEILVVSGLALGIDSASHRAALASQLPTVAVVAHGLEQIYPPTNRDLASRMVAQGGGVITEYPHGTKIVPGYFPARNRIIAALSDGIVVVEAAKKGGALITANIALSYNRILFAFPGRVGDTYSEGCNRIIANQKALMVENADDLLYGLNWQRKHPKQATQAALPLVLGDDEEKAFAALNKNAEAMAVETLLTATELPLPALTAALLSLELAGLVRTLPGNRYRRV
ncbi:MAG: DNA-processing protein DprA [Bacteroidales bacterium]|nr:DNA-processing protein DprA [Bacteroidales bacterium]